MAGGLTRAAVGVVMFVAILFRIPLHTGRTGHQMGHHPHIYPA